MRLTLVTSTLSGGGSERTLVFLANHWAKLGWSVTLIALAGEGSRDQYVLVPGVKKVVLGIFSSDYNRLFNAAHLVRIARVRRAIVQSQAHLVISFINKVNVVTLLATRGLSIPVVVSERSDPFLEEIGFLWNILRRVSYPSAGRVVVQTERAAGFFSYLGDQRISVLPNTVPMPRHRREEPTEDVLLAVGRLSHEKGLDLLMKAFQLTRESSPGWKLIIYGEGRERKSLEQLCANLGLSDCIKLKGWVDAPFCSGPPASLFVLPSRYEGFPNALLEAMAKGLPVVAFDCPGGIREIVEHGINGLLVPRGDVQELANALNRLMSDVAARRRLGERAKEVTTRFSVDEVMAKWDHLVNEVTTV